MWPTQTLKLKARDTSSAWPSFNSILNLFSFSIWLSFQREKEPSKATDYISDSLNLA